MVSSSSSSSSAMRWYDERGGGEGGGSVEKDDLDSGRGEWWTTTGRWGGDISGIREIEVGIWGGREMMIWCLSWQNYTSHAFPKSHSPSHSFFLLHPVPDSPNLPSNSLFRLLGCFWPQISIESYWIFYIYIQKQPGNNTDKWQQAYRFLGAYIDCTNSKEGGGHSHDNNNNEQDSGSCSRWMIWAAVSIYHEPSALVLLREFVCRLLSSSSRNRLVLALLVVLFHEHSHLNIPFGCNHILPHTHTHTTVHWSQLCRRRVRWIFRRWCPRLVGLPLTWHWLEVDRCVSPGVLSVHRTNFEAFVVSVANYIMIVCMRLLAVCWGCPLSRP